MLFYKYICDYILENITRTQLIDGAIECIENGVESENLYILAGLSEYDNIELYYKLILDELKIKEPDKINAAKYLILFYCKELTDKKLSPKIFLKKIKDTIYDKIYKYYKDEKGDNDYSGIKPFIDTFYLISEINDPNNEYYDGKNRREETIKEYKNCYKEAEKYIKNNNAKIK